MRLRMMLMHRKVMMIFRVIGFFGLLLFWDTIALDNKHNLNRSEISRCSSFQG